MTKEKYLSLTFTSESQFQAATFRYINANYPAIRHLFFHVPNEQASSDLMRLKMASMGVLRGVPDLLFLWPVVWGLELKFGKNALSPHQRSLHELWKNHGIPVFTCWASDEVVAVLNRQLS